MTIKHFEAIPHHQPGLVAIDLCGDLTAQAGPALNAAYNALESQNPNIIYLNFARVNYINSNGIALMISLLAQAWQSSRTLVAYGVRPFHAELFQLAGLHDYMRILQRELSVRFEKA